MYPYQYLVEGNRPQYFFLHAFHVQIEIVHLLHIEGTQDGKYRKAGNIVMSPISNFVHNIFRIPQLAADRVIVPMKKIGPDWPRFWRETNVCQPSFPVFRSPPALQCGGGLNTESPPGTEFFKAEGARDMLTIVAPGFDEKSVFLELCI